VLYRKGRNAGPSNRLSALLSLSILQPTIHRPTLPVDITTDDPFYSLWRYFNQLSALPTIRSALSGVTTTDYHMCTSSSGDTTTNYRLYSACRYCNRPSPALHCLSKLQLTICSTNYPLYYFWWSGDTTTEYPLEYYPPCFVC
jgi:hypothetical protein